MVGGRGVGGGHGVGVRVGEVRVGVGDGRGSGVWMVGVYRSLYCSRSHHTTHHKSPLI